MLPTTGFTVLLLSSAFMTADANAFLKASHSLRQERMSKEDVEISLLAEVEGTFGNGAASSRVKQIEARLEPMYAALPKNDRGFLGHATVRYALHRLFVQRHGWFINGLHVPGGHRNSTADVGLLKEHVPAYIQDLFEKRLGGRGFGLHELGVLAATIEHLVHSEAIKRLGEAFKVHEFLPTSLLNENEVDGVLDTYMTSYILGEDLSNMTLRDANELKAEMPDLYMAWNDTRNFVRGVRSNVTDSDGTAEQKRSGQLDFSIVAHVAEKVGEQFGGFQDMECQQIRASLASMEEPGTGRVRLSDFYKPAIGGQWQFQESVSYLRQLGALDETDADKPRVIIANYMSSPSNCIASSSFYSVCCMDQCEGFLGHLEQQIAAPEATPTLIARLVSQLSNSSVPWKLPAPLLDRLNDIAATHGGNVPLHGRLFAQWMHHVFPRECPYPHLSGTTNPQTPDEWLESTGEETTATDEEMSDHVRKADIRLSAGRSSSAQDYSELAPLPWSPEEELLVVRPQPNQAPAGNTLLSKMSNAMTFATMMSIVYGLLCKSASGKSTSAAYAAEKLLV